MEPARPSSFNPAGAGGLLIGTTAAGIGAGTLVGWSAGSAAIGALAGAAVGIPAGIFVVYRRYRDAIVSAGSVTSPRPAPNALLPAIGGGAAIAAALPDLPRGRLAARRLGARRHALAGEPGVRVPAAPPAHEGATSPPPESPASG